MSTLRIRSYNFGFGDALLLSVPDRARSGAAKLRHVLIDSGNVPAGSENHFEGVMQDIMAVLDGRSLDLYVMSHEHLDHVQGLFYAATKLGLELPVRCAWLPASSAPSYYTDHSQAKEKRFALADAFKEIGEYTRALQAAGEEVPQGVQEMLLNNNIMGSAGNEPIEPPADPLQTADCIKYLRTLAKEKTSYVHRETADLDQTHPFQETHFEIWGPEEDSAAYYGRFRPLALSVSPAKRRNSKPKLHYLAPPPGVDTSAFYHLVESRRSSFTENLLAIDHAADNSSIVFALEWRGRRLLFPGDAQIHGWKMMHKHKQLKPVDFLKVSHHGSDNGTPGGAMLDKILPIVSGDGQERVALISTLPGGDNRLPNAETVARLEGQGVLVREVEEEEFVDFEFLG